MGRRVKKLQEPKGEIGKSKMGIEGQNPHPENRRDAAPKGEARNQGEATRRMAALRSPTAPCERPFEERSKAEVMSSGDLAVV